MKTLDHDEQELLESFEHDKLTSVITSKDQLVKYQQAATATLKKNKRINIRIPEKDLDDIKLIAVEEGMPYQTLIASVLHKFIRGKLIEKPHKA